ncbi:cupin [filamentous cyanobacterium CCP2]|nr:cupin [filamentous cyanobacterium CCP2]
MSFQKDTNSSNFNNSLNSSQDLNGNPKKIIRIRPDAQTLTHQSLSDFVGVSQVTAGATGISMNIAVIPPGASAEPHSHDGYETVIYIVKGRVKALYGQGLQQSVVVESGDFLFVPPNVPHQPHNLSAIEPVYAIVARNTPHEQENVIPYDPTLNH